MKGLNYWFPLVVAGLLGLSVVVISAARAQAQTPADQTDRVSELIKELKDEDWLVRQSAAWKLGEHKDTRALQPLIEVALTDKMLPVRERAKEALYKIADKETVRRIVMQKMKGADKQPERGTKLDRRYSVMSAEEARSIAEKIIKSRQVPPPDPVSYWKLPDIALHASGVKVDSQDYIVFASAEPSRVLVMPDTPPGPAFLLVENELMARSFVLSGVLFSTVDFEIVEVPVFTTQGRKWTRQQQVERGGYKWYVGAAGVYLEDPMNRAKIVYFDEPIPDFSFAGRFPVDLSVNPAAFAGIAVRLGGKVIRIR